MSTEYSAQIRIIRVGMVISPEDCCIAAYEILEENSNKSEKPEMTNMAESGFDNRT